MIIETNCACEQELLPFACLSLFVLILVTGTLRWRIGLRHCATSGKVAGSIPDGVIRIFLFHYCPGADSASNRNEYQEHLLEVKAAGA